MEDGEDVVLFGLCFVYDGFFCVFVVDCDEGVCVIGVGVIVGE